MAVKTVLMVTAKCGHEVPYESENKSSDWRVKSDIERTQRNLCDACELASQAEHLGITLPELAGSERQVAWAIDLRSRFLNGVMHLVADEVSRQVVAEIALHSEAKFWIEERERATAANTEALIAKAREAVRPTPTTEEQKVGRFTVPDRLNLPEPLKPDEARTAGRYTMQFIELSNRQQELAQRYEDMRLRAIRHLASGDLGATEECIARLGEIGSELESASHAVVNYVRL